MDPSAPPTKVLESPVEETSILRSGPAGVALRRKLERPARAGRLVLTMLGVVTAGAGVAMLSTAGNELGAAFTAFGGVLLSLGVVQHVLYRRDQAHWPEQAYLWSDGVELVLHNGEVRGASWSDPDLALQLIARRAPSPIVREYILIWLSDPKVPPVELTESGFEQLRQQAADHGLDLSQTRRGSRADSVQMIHIHPSVAAIAAARAKTAEASGPG